LTFKFPFNQCQCSKPVNVSLPYQTLQFTGRPTLRLPMSEPLDRARPQAAMYKTSRPIKSDILLGAWQACWCQPPVSQSCFMESPPSSQTPSPVCRTGFCTTVMAHTPLRRLRKWLTPATPMPRQASFPLSTTVCIPMSKTSWSTC
jgi:hypothetical protein